MREKKKDCRKRRKGKINKELCQRRRKGKGKKKFQKRKGEEKNSNEERKGKIKKERKKKSFKKKEIKVNKNEYVKGWLVVFYGISTLVGNLMPNSVYIFILNIWFVNE